MIAITIIIFIIILILAIIGTIIIIRIILMIVGILSVFSSTPPPLGRLARAQARRRGAACAAGAEVFAPLLSIEEGSLKVYFRV